MHFAADKKEKGEQLLSDSVKWWRVLTLYLVPLYETEKSLWEHYNDLTAKLDATQKTEWQDTANSILVFVRLSSSLDTFL